MKLTRIDYNGGYLWVDKEAECPIGEYLYLEKGGLYETHIVIINYGRQQNSGDGFKVVAKSPNLSIPNVPYVEFEEEDAIIAMGKKQINDSALVLENEKLIALTWYIRGFEANKGRYSEADLEAAVAFGITLERFKDDKGRLSNDEEFKGFKESLNQQPQEIEIETKQVCGNMSCLRMALNNKNSTCCGESIVTIPITYMRDGKTYLKVKK
jgi:hypothetical protein